MKPEAGQLHKVIWGWFVGQQMNKRIKALEETIATLRGDTI